MTNAMECQIDDAKFQRLVQKLSTELANPKMVRRILGPAMTIFVRAVRAKVTSPQRLAVSVKPTVGYRLKSRAKHLTTAKVGFGLRKSARPHSGPGVGIGYKNVHLAVLGSSERRTKSGASRGAMPAFFRGILAPTVSSKMRAALQKIEEQLKKEVSRIEKGG